MLGVSHSFLLLVAIGLLAVGVALTFVQRKQEGMPVQLTW